MGEPVLRVFEHITRVEPDHLLDGLGAGLIGLVRAGANQSPDAPCRVVVVEVLELGEGLLDEGTRQRAGVPLVVGSWFGKRRKHAPLEFTAHGVLAHDEGIAGADKPPQVSRIGVGEQVR